MSSPPRLTFVLHAQAPDRYLSPAAHHPHAPFLPSQDLPKSAVRTDEEGGSGEQESLVKVLDPVQWRAGKTVEWSKRSKKEPEKYPEDVDTVMLLLDQTESAATDADEKKGTKLRPTHSAEVSVRGAFSFSRKEFQDGGMPFFEMEVHEVEYFDPDDIKGWDKSVAHLKQTIGLGMAQTYKDVRAELDRAGLVTGQASEARNRSAPRLVALATDLTSANAVLNKRADKEAVRIFDQWKLEDAEKEEGQRRKELTAKTEALRTVRSGSGTKAVQGEKDKDMAFDFKSLSAHTKAGGSGSGALCVGIGVHESFGYYSNARCAVKTGRGEKGNSSNKATLFRPLKDGSSKGSSGLKVGDARFLPTYAQALAEKKSKKKHSYAGCKVGCGFNINNREVFFTLQDEKEKKHAYVGTADFRACGPREPSESEPSVGRAQYSPVVSFIHVKRAVVTLRWRRRFVVPDEDKLNELRKGQADEDKDSKPDKQRLAKRKNEARNAVKGMPIGRHSPYYSLPMHLPAGHPGTGGMRSRPTRDVALPDIPYLPEIKDVMDYLFLRHDACADDTQAKDVHRIIEDYVHRQVALHNRRFLLGEQVKLRPRTDVMTKVSERDVCDAAPFPTEVEDMTYTICRVPPPGGHGTFVSDVLAESFVVKENAPRENKDKWRPEARYHQLLGPEEMMRTDKGAERRQQVHISRRFVRVLTQAVRYSHNPLAAALASAFACTSAAQLGSVTKNQSRELLLQAEKFSRMAYCLVDDVKDASQDGTLLPRNWRALTRLPMQRRDETAIEMALTLQDKNFTHHPACEDFVDHVWKGGATTIFDLQMPSAQDVRNFERLGRVVSSNISKLNDIDSILSPIFRFFTAFGLLLLLVSLQHIVVFAAGGQSAFASCGEFTSYELIFIFASFGFVVHEIEEVKSALVNGRGGKYLADGWNIVDWGLHSIFVAYFVVRWRGILLHSGPTAQCDAAGPGADTPRTALRILSFNCVLLWMRLMNVMTVSERLGPMIRMITLMAKSVAIFLVLLFMYIIGFAGTFQVWFNKVANDDAADLEDLRVDIIESLNGTTAPNTDLDSAGFTTLPRAMLTLFGAALGDFSFDEIRKEQPILGPVLMMLYLFVGAVMLLNLLIAILADVYNRVQEGSMEEFSFSKAKTVSTYSIFWDKGNTVIPLPPPLNLVTFLLEPVAAVLGSLQWLWRQAKRAVRSCRSSEGARASDALGMFGGRIEWERQQRYDDSSLSTLCHSLVNAGLLVIILSFITGVLVWVATLVAFLIKMPASLFALAIPDALQKAWVDACHRAGSTRALKAPSGGGQLHGSRSRCRLLLAVLFALPIAALYVTFEIAKFFVLAAVMLLYLCVAVPILMIVGGLGSMGEVCDPDHLDFPPFYNVLKKFQNDGKTFPDPKKEQQQQNAAHAGGEGGGSDTGGGAGGGVKKTKTCLGTNLNSGTAMTQEERADQVWRGIARYYRGKGGQWDRNNHAKAAKWWAQLVEWRIEARKAKEADQVEFSCTDPRYHHAVQFKADAQKRISELLRSVEKYDRPESGACGSGGASSSSSSSGGGAEAAPDKTSLIKAKVRQVGKKALKDKAVAAEKGFVLGTEQVQIYRDFIVGLQCKGRKGKNLGKTYLQEFFLYEDFVFCACRCAAPCSVLLCFALLRFASLCASLCFAHCALHSDRPAPLRCCLRLLCAQTWSIASPTPSPLRPTRCACWRSRQPPTAQRTRSARSGSWS